MVATGVIAVDGGVAEATSDEPPIDGHGDDEGDGEREDQAPPEEPSSRPAAIAPGTARTMRVSTISIVVIDRVSPAIAARTAVRNGSPAARSGRIVRP